MWQNIVVALIGIAVLIKLGLEIRKIFFEKRKNNVPSCSGCSCYRQNKTQNKLKKNV